MAPVPLFSSALSARATAKAAVLAAAGAELARRAAPLMAMEPRSLSSPNHTQAVTIGVIAAYAVAIGILWNVPYLRYILWPFKMLTVAFHEFSHAFAAKLTCSRVQRIELDPREGGVTLIENPTEIITLPAGYLGSSLIGALLIFCGFDIVASKVASFVLGATFLLLLWWAWRDWVTVVTLIIAIGVLIAGWLIAHSEPLRFIVLFLGVMSALYSVWDICDDLIVRKVPTSDASVFAARYGGSSACWGIVWMIVAVLFMAASIVAGLAAFPESFSEQETDSSHFVPTF